MSDLVQNQGIHIGPDTHSMWQKAIEKRNCEKQIADKEDGILDKIHNFLNRKKETKNSKNLEQNKIQDEMIQDFVKQGEGETFRQNKIECKKQLEELKDSLVSQSHGYGDNTNGEKLGIINIGTSAPLIDWRLLLKEAISYDVDWSYQNASVEDVVVTAYLEEKPTPETEIVLDTSGSINQNLLRNFLRECKNILKISRVKVGCFDTKFYGFTEIRNMSDIDNLSFYGGGGTDFDVAVNAFSRRVENKIIFTDGCATMPNMRTDAIWIVFGDRKIEPIGGRVIYINDEYLEKLLNLEIVHKGKTR